VEGAREAAIREHGAILDAIRRQEGAAARTLMSDHLRRSYNEWAQAGSVDPMALRLPRPD
jgi:DNA-binding FadR family transcriptional regulator